MGERTVYNFRISSQSFRGLCLKGLASTSFCPFFRDVPHIILSLLPSLYKAIPTYFLKSLSLGGYDVFISLTEDMKLKTAWSWGQFPSSRWDKLSELPSGNSFLLESGHLLGKRVWESYSEVILPQHCSGL